MKPCPGCSTYGTLSFDKVLVAKPLGTYSLAGQQEKVAVEERYKLSCSVCEWSVYGYIEDGYFVADLGQQ